VILDSPYGPIRSAWRLDGDRLRLSVDVPPGTRAEIRLPDGSSTGAVPVRSSASGLPGSRG
jgi:alpha-L-rhamnosidase